MNTGQAVFWGIWRKSKKYVPGFGRGNTRISAKNGYKTSKKSSNVAEEELEKRYVLSFGESRADVKFVALFQNSLTF
jgi:hypothetical protein